MCGISLGFRLLVMAVGLGLGQVFEQVPQLYTLLRYLGAAYLLYLAWKIANSGAPDSHPQAAVAEGRSALAAKRDGRLNERARPLLQEAPAHATSNRDMALLLTAGFIAHPPDSHRPGVRRSPAALPDRFRRVGARHPARRFPRRPGVPSSRDRGAARAGPRRPGARRRCGVLPARGPGPSSPGFPRAGAGPPACAHRGLRRA